MPRHLLLAFATMAVACARPAPPGGPAGAAGEVLPPVLREFRGVWVATVDNIDWPSEPGLSTAGQRAELREIIARAAGLGLNAVILQVRPAADALYPSPLEPWSEYLTGAMGRPPEPSWDPLAFAVEEAHRRGLELHAWFNPYRARHRSAISDASPDHISRARPELVRRYGEQLWMDPGEADVRERTLAVVLDVVRRYDVDGVHMDDYFYPYPVRDSTGAEVAFPDDPSWNRYRSSGGELDRPAWRRSNVDRLVRGLAEEVHREKPWVKFGVSPFGIWRPGNPPQIEGFDAYAGLYADARRWLRAGWVDYLTPQLYWPVARRGQSYPVLLGWWAAENVGGRHLWPGSHANRAWGEDPAWPPDEVAGQIYVARGHPGVEGHVLFSARSLVAEGPLPEALREGPYARPALVPPSPWLDDDPPARPRVRIVPDDPGAGGDPAPGSGVLRIRFRPGDGEDPRVWLVQLRIEGEWEAVVVPGSARALVPDRSPPGEPPRRAEAVAVSAVDRVGNRGPAAVIRVPAGAPAARR